MKPTRIAHLVSATAFLVMLSGCATTSLNDANRDVDFAVATMAKMAQYVQSSDWIGYSEELETAFTEKELDFLEQHKDAIAPVIGSQLNTDDSIYGAKLAGRFKLVEMLRYIRHQLIKPKHPYGWEGTDSSDLDQMASGHQFQHHAAYVDAIREITGAPLRSSLTEKDIEKINQFKDDEENPYYYWSVWLSRELDKDAS